MQDRSPLPITARWPAIAIAAAIASVGAAASAPAQHTAPPPAPKAAKPAPGDEELAQAEQAAAKAQYRRALDLYRKIVDRFPGTRAAKVAATRTQPNALLGWAPLVDNGPPENRIDVVVMGDGYTIAKQNAFDDIARAIPKTFAQDKVLGEYLPYHNFLRANVVSREDGVDGYNRKYDTALGGHVLDFHRVLVGIDREAVKRMADELPYHDALAIVIVNKGDGGTGGGGIAAVGGRDEATIVHEWGHAFAGLSDEYIDHVHRGSAQDGINVAGTEDPKSVPWRHWLEADAPGIGVYEGAGGMQRGAWKPTTGGCRMENGRRWCKVCAEALVLEIYRRVDPIDGCTPEAHPFTETQYAFGRDDVLRFEVQPMQPKSHALEVRWWLLPEQDAPRSNGQERHGPLGLRDRRGPLPPIKQRPSASTLEEGASARSFRVDPGKLGPGRWRVVCRVRDTTRISSDDLWPVVLKDEQGLLESERGWWIQ